MLKQKKKYIMFFLALIVFLVMITNDSRVIAASETNNEIITMQEAEGIAINHFYSLQKLQNINISEELHIKNTIELYDAYENVTAYMID